MKSKQKKLQKDPKNNGQALRHPDHDSPTTRPAFDHFLTSA